MLWWIPPWIPSIPVTCDSDHLVFFFLANRRTAAYLNPALVNLASIVIIIIMRTWSVKTVRELPLAVTVSWRYTVHMCRWWRRVRRSVCRQSVCVCGSRRRAVCGAPASTGVWRRWWNIKALILDFRWLVPVPIEKLLMKLLAHNMQGRHAAVVWYARVSFMSAFFNLSNELYLVSSQLDATEWKPLEQS